MPTEHKKKKAKTVADKVIKKESQDLHPLSHYIDDRVELIRQIFMSLKSKTIKSIAPDFMQGQSLETIQEHCLDELLGISTKRLQSIINATPCPDNTDSSDSDVEKIEEHISLEEISSDSADDALQAKKPKGKSTAKHNENGDSGSGKKEISVLELLELQARARAIRSQLALEPVTKIELDSDNDSDGSSNHKSVKNKTSTTSENRKGQTEKVNVESRNAAKETNGMQVIKPTVPKVKPVRLKRNFRQRQNEDYDPDDDDETRSVENAEAKDIEKKSVDEKQENITVDVKQRRESERSLSPDLIPIIQEPETYCISSDSDENSSNVPKYITYPTVVREKLPETEDEKFLKKIKEGSGTDLRNLIKARRADHSETIVTAENATPDVTENGPQSELSSNLENSNKEIPTNKSNQKDDDTEPEEGELTDGDDNGLESNQITILSSDDEIDDKTKKCKMEIPEEVERIDENDESSTDSSSSENDSDTDSSHAPTFKEGDDDDDIIDLGKDEELDFEMKDMEQSRKTRKKLRKSKKKIDDVDKPLEDLPEAAEEATPTESNDKEVVNGSEETTEPADRNEAPTEKETAEDSTESDTWQSRWLRGRNVTKVMATSRLANKVRTKIKQKKSKKEETLSDATTVTEAVLSTSTVEEGSVQHYEELLARDADNKNE
ncbi:hypothetical protein Bhyg_15154 [Pseudolycoriella hygida]|uniref:Uncharacterized protein n=1 Tax=Pseudolycoriella hygida TaxID=35572 RepID=A0A9Q0RY47_9DIPT|nr:hypothetical protein Bhyg_15154 [Pseudolycoriella hygida]